jgi:hypothetical protein
MAAAGFHVDTEVLRWHGSRVDQVSGDLAAAQRAAGTTDLHGGAFGTLCGFLPPFVAGTDTAARDAIAAVQQATEQTAGDLRSMAEAYDRVDDQVAERLRAIARRLDG